MAWTYRSLGEVPRRRSTVSVPRVTVVSKILVAFELPGVRWRWVSGEVRADQLWSEQMRLEMDNDETAVATAKQLRAVADEIERVVHKLKR